MDLLTGTITWLNASKYPPPHSDAMNTISVLIWYEGRARFGYYLGGHLMEWRLDSENSPVDIKLWSPINAPDNIIIKYFILRDLLNSHLNNGYMSIKNENIIHVLSLMRETDYPSIEELSKFISVLRYYSAHLHPSIRTLLSDFNV
jgi:hypothetical protein